MPTLLGWTLPLVDRRDVPAAWKRAFTETFGAELRAVQQARQMRERGSEPAIPDANARHVAGEERAVGERLARARGLRFVAEPPSGYRGMLVELDAAGTVRYVAVVDERSRTVAVVSRSLVPPDAVGRAVEILRRADGSLALRRRDLAKDA